MKTSNGEGIWSRYPWNSGKRIFVMTTAIAVDGSTDVPVEATAGSFGCTTHNTGKTHPFISDGAKWINANITGPFAFGDITGNAADNASLVAYIAAAIGYLNYEAKLVQIAGAAPSPTVLNNDLAGAVAWTRNSAGIYTGTLAGAFLNNKVIAWATGQSNNLVVSYDLQRATDNTVVLKNSSVSDDNIVSVGIHVYP
jgi:hypothetical protein